MRKLIIVVTICVVVSGSGLYYLHSRTQPASSSYRTAKVERGAVVSEVSCSGTVNPVTTVKVGAEVSGKIRDLFVDFNSEVTEGQLIAQIDPESFEAAVRQGEADLKVAQANVLIRKAAVERAKAELESARSDFAASVAQTEKARVTVVDAKREFVRMKSLHESQSIPDRQLEQVETTYEQASAQHNLTEAQQEASKCTVNTREALLKMEIAQLSYSEAQVEHRKAALATAQIDLEHSSIRSPVNGVVISREVDVGQTVIARLQAPLLFVIAQDLRKMQIEASVDEADIGRIGVGHKATFTVDAYPGRKFTCKVDQIRKAPLEVQNVVTYKVVATADNPDLALLPGMTANVQIVVRHLQDVLKVPNAALRFQPAGTGSGPAESSAGRGADAAGEDSPKERLQQLIEHLNLTKEQQAKVWEAYAEVRNRVMEQMAQGGGPQKLSIAKEAARQRMKAAIASILTPEQKEKQAKLLAGRERSEIKKGKVWITDRNGKPDAVDTIIGVSDGAFTQVVSGNLKEGQLVIVGIERHHP